MRLSGVRLMLPVGPVHQPAVVHAVQQYGPRTLEDHHEHVPSDRDKLLGLLPAHRGT